MPVAKRYITNTTRYCMKRIKASLCVRQDILERAYDLAKKSPLSKGAVVEMAIEAGLPEVELKINRMIGFAKQSTNQVGG